MTMNLFDDDADDIDEISKIETDIDFAKRYEHNKKREDLQRLEELKKKGLAHDSDDSEDDSEDSADDDLEGLISGKNDLEFFDGLLKIRNKDPIINKKDAKLFESDSEEEGEKEKTKKKKKPMFLKDVVARNLIEDGPEEMEEDGPTSGGVKSYFEEQDEIRKAVIDAFEGEEGDLLKEKMIGDEGEDENEDEVKKKMGEYFGDDDEKLEENDMFLKKFFLNKMWVDEDKGKKPYSEDLYVLSEDEEEVEKQEKYEAEYNFRFEEGAGDRILGHARFTEGSVRKKSNARKLQRLSKAERMVQAEFDRKEELKHLKNLKKKEIEEKLEKIRAIAGIGEGGGFALNEDDLEEDFDPKEYDRKMKETFDGDYDVREDVDPDIGSDGDEDDDDLKKPDFDKEDELIGLPKDWDVCGSGDAFSATREKILKRKAEDKDSDSSASSEEVEEELPGESKRKRKRKISLREKLALDEVLEEYYKLDYEDTIGDLKTRFKYTSVPSRTFGMKSKDVLMTNDKELNQYVPLQRLAPYRETEWKVPKHKRYSQKMKTLGQGKDLKDRKNNNKHKRIGDGPSTTETGSMEQGKSQLEESNGEVAKVSRKTKRKRRQAALKLPHSRLVAYGKIPATSKNKKKH